MLRKQNPNLQILESTVAALGPLADEFVFLGGCATGLLITDPAAPPIRATRDVDVITELASLRDYHALGKRLRAQGFTEDKAEGALICRWRGAGVILDVMATDPAILGFGNEYYQPALRAAQIVRLPSAAKIRMVTAPWFLLTKLAAFAGRGADDYVLSHDIEDIVAVIDGRPELMQEVEQADDSLRQHLSQRFATLLKNKAFMAALSGHMPPDTSSPARLPLIEKRIRVLAGVV